MAIVEVMLLSIVKYNGRYGYIMVWEFATDMLGRSQLCCKQLVGVYS